MNNFTFALPSGFNWDIKIFVRQVKTKKWVKDNFKHLEKWQYKLTSANIDNRQVIGGLLQSAYGGNIGYQIEQKLTDDDLAKVRRNIIFHK